jgi:release factor glutamine methyltransferase
MAETTLAVARKAADHLLANGIENARHDAELLLAAVLGTSRLDLYLQHDRPLTEAELQAYRTSIRRRLKREPVQYILGDAAFRELTLKVDKRVLIPRPETEVLVGVVLDFMRGRLPADAASGRVGEWATTALDLGTGSGAIALSLLREGPFERVVATDVSADALAVARDNAVRAGLDARLELRCGSLWDAVDDNERFDVVVSNPPYVADSGREELQAEVRDWEPAVALFGGASGTLLLHVIVDGARRFLREDGLLALEVGMEQAEGIAERARTSAGFAWSSVAKDYTGRDRIVLAGTGIKPEGT